MATPATPAILATLATQVKPLNLATLVIQASTLQFQVIPVIQASTLRFQATLVIPALEFLVIVATLVLLLVVLQEQKYTGLQMQAALLLIENLHSQTVF